MKGTGEEMKKTKELSSTQIAGMRWARVRKLCVAHVEQNHPEVWKAIWDDARAKFPYTHRKRKRGSTIKVVNGKVRIIG
jgi:hypothetical protein